MKRQRADGTWTFTTADWDARWYWTVGTRVTARGLDGIIVKVHQVTVDVDFDDGRIARKVPMPELTRAGGSQ